MFWVLGFRLWGVYRVLSFKGFGVLSLRVSDVLGFKGLDTGLRNFGVRSWSAHRGMGPSKNSYIEVVG